MASPIIFGPSGPININNPQAGNLVSDAQGNLSSAGTANGQLLIGNGTGVTPSTLTAGTNVTITNGAGTITIASSGGGGSGGAFSIQNAGLQAAQVSSQLVVTLTTAAGATPSSSDSVVFPFRNILSGGSPFTSAPVSVQAAQSLVIPVGATLGLAQNLTTVLQYIWIYEYWDGVNANMACCGGNPVNDTIANNVFALTSSSTTAGVLYSTGSVAGLCAIRLLGRVTIHSVSGSGFAAAPDQVEVYPVIRHNTTVPVSYTPTFTGLGTPASTVVRSWREGQFLNINGAVTAGTPTGVTATFTPGFNGTNSAVTMDTGLYGPNNLPLGTWGCVNTANSSGYVLYTNSQTLLTFGSNYASTSGVGILGNVMGGAGNLIIFQCRVPIVGWWAYGP